jgi:hypothetical protein
MAPNTNQQLSTTTSRIMLSCSPKKLGRTGNALDIQLTNFPPISSPVETKAPAFNFFSDNLEAHLATSPFSEASAFITSHVPISSGSALQETLHVGTTLRPAFRIVTNSSDHAFLNSTGDPIALSLLHLDNASTRPADIAT